MPDALPRLSEALADRYRLEKELGAGGMATVYLAQDLKHNRKVAVKVLRPELAAVIGAERREEYVAFPGNVLGGQVWPGMPQRNVDSFFAETRIPVFSPKQKLPLLRQLDFTAALRTENYSDFGDTVTGKLSDAAMDRTMEALRQPGQQWCCFGWRSAAPASDFRLEDVIPELRAEAHLGGKHLQFGVGLGCVRSLGLFHEIKQLFGPGRGEIPGLRQQFDGIQRPCATVRGFP